MSDIATTDDEPDSGYVRLEQQIKWYDSKSGSAQRWYKRIKFCEFVASGLVPIAALLAEGWMTATIGAAAVLLEGLQQLNQWQHNWITYRSTCEALRHEKYSYIARSGSYDGMDDVQAHRALVERVQISSFDRTCQVDNSAGVRSKKSASEG